MYLCVMYFPPQCCVNEYNVMLELDLIPCNIEIRVSCADDSIFPCDRHYPSLVVNIVNYVNTLDR